MVYHQMAKRDEGGISYIQEEILESPGWVQDAYTEVW